MATTEGVLSVSSVDINVPGGDNTSSGTAETEPNETQQLFEQFMVRVLTYIDHVSVRTIVFIFTALI
jgi:hypothetical protein